jgi:hypothetical protein
MNEKSIKAIISLLIVLLAFGIFLLFYNYQQSLLSAENFYPFILLTFVGMGLLLALLFLVNKQHHVIVVKSSKNPTKKKRK